MGGRTRRTRRVLPLVAVVAVAAGAAGLATAVPSGAAAPPVTLVGVANGVLVVIDLSQNNDAFIRIDEKNATTALIQSKDHIQLAAGCQYQAHVNKSTKDDYEEGYDRFAICYGAMARYDAYGLDGNDSIQANHPSGAVRLVGHQGNDFLKVVSGRSEIYGDEGPGDPVPNVFVGGNDTLTGGSDPDIIRGGGGNDAIRGGKGIDYLYGEMGDDVIDGGMGADHIWGGWGRDTVNGEAGKDTFHEREGNVGSDQIVCGFDDGVKDVLEYDPGIDVLIQCGVETGAKK